MRVKDAETRRDGRAETDLAYIALRDDTGRLTHLLFTVAGLPTFFARSAQARWN